MTPSATGRYPDFGSAGTYYHGDEYFCQNIFWGADSTELLIEFIWVTSIRCINHRHPSPEDLLSFSSNLFLYHRIPETHHRKYRPPTRHIYSLSISTSKNNVSYTRLYSTPHFHPSTLPNISLTNALRNVRNNSSR